jgi:hypothetical protein
MFVVHQNFGCTRVDYIYFNPRDSNFTFIHTVSKNKTCFTKRQIKDVEAARYLYSKLNYPSWKDFKWIIWSNQIKECLVTVKHIDTVLKIWGKNVTALKERPLRLNQILWQMTL